MLEIKARHVEALQRLTEDRFEAEMIAHCREFSPNLARTLSEPELRAFVRAGLERAGVYGLTMRGTLRLFLDMQMLFGSGFDEDPMYPWAREALTSEDLHEEGYRAQMLHMQACDYLEEVHGEENGHARAALVRLLAAIDEGDRSGLSEPSAEAILAFLTEVHPEKRARLGEEGLRAFVEGCLEDQRALHGPMRHRSALVMTTLRFAFGHRCFQDPLFPWLKKTFELYRGRGPDGVAERLEARARIWIDAVLKNEAPPSTSEAPE